MKCPHCNAIVFTTDAGNLTVARAFIRHWTEDCQKVPEELKQACLEHRAMYWTDKVAATR